MSLVFLNHCPIITQVLDISLAILSHSNSESHVADQIDALQLPQNAKDCLLIELPLCVWLKLATYSLLELEY
jgi:hypothetical protein